MLRVFRALVVFLILLASCGEERQTPTSTRQARATREDALTPGAATPAAERLAGGGGEFIMALGIEPPTLDPAMANDVSSSLVLRQLFSGLVRLSNELKAEPDLAKRWTVSEDGRVYTFVLREDAVFADGTPITAEDVRWSLERSISGERRSSPPAATYLNDIDGAIEKLAGSAETVRGLRVVDDRTIEITLQEPNAVFLQKFSHPPASVLDRRSVEDDDDWTERPNASGPFVLHRLTDEHLQLRSNVRHWRPARLDQLTLLIGAAAYNDLLLYEGGDVDYVEVGGYALERVSNPANPLSRELTRVEGLTLSYIGMDTQTPPFDDPKVRQAFALLIDRDALVQADSITTTVAIAAHGIVPPSMPGANQQLPRLPKPDAERVRQLLKESRYGGAENLPPIVGYGGVGLVAELLEETTGVTMELRSLDTFHAYLRGLDEHRFPIFSLSWIGDYPDPENFLEVLFGARSGSNHTRYQNPQVEQLFTQARAERDQQQRFKLYHEAELLILQDAPIIPLTHGISHVLVKPYVKGLTVTPLGLVDLSTVELVR